MDETCCGRKEMKIYRACGRSEKRASTKVPDLVKPVTPWSSQMYTPIIGSDCFLISIGEAFSGKPDQVPRLHQGAAKPPDTTLSLPTQ